ncbi:MAG: helix-turn-helix transcriptional regulator [Deltaproteobacteria bacterium]|nr:helix-turn-helix transcriptional regulator [Deltaproteobacteria bacterium]
MSGRSRLTRLMELSPKKRGQLVRAARVSLDMSQCKFAHHIGMEPQRLSRIERGESDLYFSELVELCLVMALRRRKVERK